MKNNKTEPIPIMDYRQYRRVRRLVHWCSRNRQIRTAVRRLSTATAAVDVETVAMKNNKTEPIPIMDYRQYRRVRRLVHECCNYTDGNCIALDDGKECVCAQSVSYSVDFCQFVSE